MWPHHLTGRLPDILPNTRSGFVFSLAQLVSHLLVHDILVRCLIIDPLILEVRRGTPANHGCHALRNLKGAARALVCRGVDSTLAARLPVTTLKHHQSQQPNLHWGRTCLTTGTALKTAELPSKQSTLLCSAGAICFSSASLQVLAQHCHLPLPEPILGLAACYDIPGAGPPQAPGVWCFC